MRRVLMNIASEMGRRIYAKLTALPLQLFEVTLRPRRMFQPPRIWCAVEKAYLHYFTDYQSTYTIERHYVTSIGKIEYHSAMPQYDWKAVVKQISLHFIVDEDIFAWIPLSVYRSILISRRVYSYSIMHLTTVIFLPKYYQWIQCQKHAQNAKTFQHTRQYTLVGRQGLLRCYYAAASFTCYMAVISSPAHASSLSIEDSLGWILKNFEMHLMSTRINIFFDDTHAGLWSSPIR